MKPAKILVVDDNIADIGLLRMALDQQGESYELEVILTGADALKFVRDSRAGLREPEPCVILLDLHLPHYNGLAILEALREAPPLAHVQVIVFSGLASPREQALIAEKGAHYRQKPSTLADFMKIGADILELCKNANAVLA